MHDILERSKIRDYDLLERLLDFLISNTGQLYSANSISKYLKDDNKYIKRENMVGKEKLKVKEKYYVVDTGFYTLLNTNKRNYNQILETIIYNELKKRGYTITVKILENAKVDFIAKKFKKKIYIQVSKTLKETSTHEREFKPLQKIKDNYPKYIITTDTFDFSEEGIIHLNIKEFLKNEEI